MQIPNSSLSVIALHDTNITDIIQSITLYESIDGFLQGTIQILDGINFYDEIFGRYDRLIPVEIGFEYMDEPVLNYFAIDGISGMDIKKSSKEYTLHLITAVEHGLRLETINEVYNGTSHEIIAGLWRRALGEGAKLAINTPSINTGKYVVPNISAEGAIQNVVATAVDEDKTGFYLFQRVYQNGVTQLSSLGTMANDVFKNADGSPLEIFMNVASINEKNPHALSVGSANEFRVEQYKMNHTNKLAKGFWGNNINHVRLDTTKVDNFESIESTTDTITQYKISDKLYSNITPDNSPPGPHFEHHPKSIFSTMFDSSDTAANNVKRRMNENQLRINGIVPIPFIGCGKVVKVAIGGGEINRSQSDGNYIIADINHTFVRDSEYLDYEQSMTLIREMA